MAGPVSVRYRAFLSYSHRDTSWGRWLHSALEGYRVDKDLVGRETPLGSVPRTLRPIFRDREDFSAGHSLTEQTIAALEASQFLIVICSPNAAQSKYVNEEIRHFKALGRAERIIPVIVDGEPGDPARECFPEALRIKLGADGQPTGEREEPVAADARAHGDGTDLARQKVVAALLGVPLDDIRKRDALSDNRRIKIAAAGAAVVAIVAVLAGFLWFQHVRETASREAHDKAQIEEQQRGNRALANQMTELKALIEKSSPGVPGAEKKAEDIVAAARKDDRLQRALDLLKANKTAEAEALFQAVANEKAAQIRKDSKDAAAAFRNLGTIAGLGDPKRALDAYRKALEYDPDDLSSLLWVGWIQIDRGYLDEAESQFRKLLSLAKSDEASFYQYWARLERDEEKWEPVFRPHPALT